MNHCISRLIVCLPVLFAGAALAQTPPTAEDILKAWLASPHANSRSEAFRHWDTEGEIPKTCAVCHSTTGIVDYLSAPQSVPGEINHPVPVGTTVECAACHNPGAEALRDVIFPSRQVVNMPPGSAVCTVCHQGRASGNDVNNATAGIDDDEVSAKLAFINIHYAAAASTRRGSAVRGGYQYAGRSYAGRFAHVEGFETCVSCHGSHDTAVQLETCTTCHQGAADFRTIRTSPIDVLGNGDTGLGIGAVIEELHARLKAAIMTYAAEVGGGAIVYSSGAYPYFFNDINANGIADDDEAAFPNRYQSWTPRLLKAAYNYQFVAKDRGAFAHNPRYAIQLMIDSITDLAEVSSVDASGLVRP
ncbi:MAG: polyheme membrane-associated cytochrome C [Hyphomicrobiales bacterium]|nr:polyheme membrane-associated cytochrome C [Hyphomicrobiales bacterium]